ncbi:MAG: hypothetical protein R3Y09_08920 [Clostridia bacterium]
MKNLKYFPFERNNYYYGKLLTDRDFIKEQQYFNNKRRLHNRFFHGFGVVAGLGTLAIDERTLSVEDGVAIDFSGREIIVSEPVLYKLSMISGFNQIAEEKKADHVYLCVEYNEDAKNFTKSIVSNQSDENFESSTENFHLYLTDKAPEPNQFGAENINVFNHTLYENDDVKITQEFYKTIPSGEFFEISIIVLNKTNASNIDINIEQTLEGAYNGADNKFIVEFKDLFLERGQSERKIVKLRAKKLEIGTINFILNPENFKIVVNRKKCVDVEQNTIEVPISHGNSLEVLKKDYFSNVMEDIVTNNFGGGIYLAKIFLVSRNNSFFIENIEPMPANQYVYSTHLLTGMMKELERNIASLKESFASDTANTEIVAQPSVNTGNIEYGTVEIPLKFPAKTGNINYSHEVFHNLGEGPFMVDFSVQEKDVIFTGDSGIFADRKIKANFEIKQDTKKASFIFGTKLLENTTENSIFIRYAVKKEPTSSQVDKKKLYIVPSKLEIGIRESYYLEAITNVSGTVLWSVTGENSGSISKDGTYTAPNTPGVYEVVATLEQSESMKASLFIVVRE